MYNYHIFKLLYIIKNYNMLIPIIILHSLRVTNCYENLHPHPKCDARAESNQSRYFCTV